jgi:hypothetical protein
LKNRKDIATGVVGLLLAGTAAVGLWGWHREHQRAADLEAQVAQLTKQEMQSAVLRSVSKQMEEIAYQQKEISDEQREEALQQTRVANEMRQQSEVERKKALVAQENALASEKRAQEARIIAEMQRKMAEHQRVQAELSKRVADTLSYVALGRSLGSLSSLQTQMGDTELGDKLAYASYLFSKRYGGDLYYPAVFQSLMTASQSKRSWTKHQGALMALAMMPGKDDRIVTVSSYGGIIMHEKLGDELQSNVLLDNNIYDFRDVYVNKQGDIYVVSRTGYLAIINSSATKVIPVVNLDCPMWISELDDNNLLLVGENGLAQYDINRGLIVATRELDFHMTAVSRYDYHPLLFDDKGRQHLVMDINELITTDVPVNGRVTAFASSKKSGKRVYGMSDGTIYLMDELGNKITKLGGHLSRISRLKMVNNQLYSSSYDGTLRFWNTNSEKIEPMTMLSAGAWIMNFTFDSSKHYAWIGDQNGNVTEALLSVPEMVDIISKKLKSNFTQEEWHYYIGHNVPYEEIMSDSRKEVAP